MATCGAFLQSLASGAMDASLVELYGPESLSVQKQRFQDLLTRMERWSEQEPVILVSTPGRTELGGNHTDHNHGVVLAAGIHYDCLAAASAVVGTTVRIWSKGFSDEIVVDISDIAPRKEEEGTAEALVRGVAAGFAARGWRVGGFDCCIMGEVPVGAGLSSSAAFEVCLGQIFNQLYNSGQCSPLDLATVGREAENVHFGKPCGFMDQIACAYQGVLSIDFDEPATPAVREVDVDFADMGYQLMVVDTGGSHADLTPEYAAIPEEMMKASGVLGQHVARGLDMDTVLANAADIRREAGDRGLLRLIHFIEENERAVLQADALDAGDMARYLELVNESGDSSWRLLQNCISTTDFLEQGIPVALTLTERFLAGDGAWRVQGGGFAGTIQAYVPLGRVDEYRRFMEGVFGEGSVLPLRIRKPGLDRIHLHTEAGR